MMRRQMLGKSMLEVPVVAAGCMRIQGMDETEVDEYIHTCLELGIQFFDHADIYGKGACESLFGRVFEQTEFRREDIILQSKCGIVPGVMYDFSKEHILQSVEESLRRLRTDYLDIQIISTQPAERFLYRLQNMFFGKVIHHTRYNPAFRLQDDIFSAKFCLLEYTSEQRFACPFSINIRMIKKLNSQFQTGMDILIHLCLIHSLNTHTSSCNYRNFQHTFSKHLPSHHVPPF